MGANLRTAFLQHAQLEEVERAVAAWLSAKGFEPEANPSPVWPSQMGGRGLVLAENASGVTVAYSDPWIEGDRLVFELLRIRPVLLECWLHDSDLWGYKLHRDGEVVAAFCSDPRYFGGESHDEDAVRLGRNGDAKLLTATLGLPEKEQDLRDLQVKRRIFAEALTQSFAELIEAPALAIDYQDWLEYGVQSTQGVLTLADHRVRAVVYLPREEPEGKRWNLHDVPARKLVQPSTEDYSPMEYAIPDSTIWLIALLRAIAIPLGLILRVAMIPIALAIRLRPQLVLGRAFDASIAFESSPLRKAIYEEGAARARRMRKSTGEADVGDPQQASGPFREGERYVHQALGFSLLPAPGVTVVAASHNAQVCILQAGDRTGALAPQGFEAVDNLFGNLPGEPLEDLKETADGLPLRMIVCDLASSPFAAELARLQSQKSQRRWNWFGLRKAPKNATPADVSPEDFRCFYAAVQEQRFVYYFAMQFVDRDAQTLEALKTTMRSFRRVASSDAASAS